MPSRAHDTRCHITRLEIGCWSFCKRLKKLQDRMLKGLHAKLPFELYRDLLPITLVGTAITLINDSSAGAITIAITSDTLVLAGTGSTGSRTLAANGDATLLKIGATRWRINGTGLT